MAHQIYLTKGIILKKKDFGEADRLFWVYTEKFGMIMAAAKGARLQKSKLRYGLELFSLSHFAVICSGEFWQITDARDICLVRAGTKLDIFAKVGALLLRMIKGQERNDLVWLELENFHNKLFLSEIAPENIKEIEIGAMANILRGLGYMASLPAPRNMAISAINKAIKESML